MTRQFEHRSTLRTTVEAVTAFHAHPRAFQRLTPPPVFVRIHRNDLKSLTEGEVEFTLWLGFIPFRWTAQHESGPIPTSFIDRQVKGPLQSWEHQHIFEPVEGGVELVDRITFAHKPGWRGIVTRLLFDGPALRFLFIYRHQRTRWAVRQKGN